MSSRLALDPRHLTNGSKQINVSSLEWLAKTTRNDMSTLRTRNIATQLVPNIGSCYVP